MPRIGKLKSNLISGALPITNNLLPQNSTHLATTVLETQKDKFGSKRIQPFSFWLLPSHFYNLYPLPFLSSVLLCDFLSAASLVYSILYQLCFLLLFHTLLFYFFLIFFICSLFSFPSCRSFCLYFM